MSVEPVVELLGVAVGVGADFAEHPFVEIGDRQPSELPSFPRV